MNSFTPFALFFFTLKPIIRSVSIIYIFISNRENIFGKVESLVFAHLCWHMHQEYSSDRSLSLTITLFGTMQSVSLEHAEQVLLPEGMNIQYINDAYLKKKIIFSHIDTLMGIMISL